MRFEARHLPKRICFLGLLTIGLFACAQSNDGGTGSGGTPGNGGTTSTGGVGSGGKSGSGGSVNSGGTKGSGGAEDTGGTTTEATGGNAQGGSKGSGGSESGGTTGTETGEGGDQGTGGASEGGTTGGGGRTVRPNTGGAAAGGTTGGDSTPRDAGQGAGGRTTMGGSTGAGGSTGMGGSTGSGDCQKGQVKGNEVVIMGESFYAMSPQYIQKRIEDNARKAGALGANESYRNVAVSGQPMSYIASTEWDNAKKSTTKLVIMDGGGIDCMSSSCSSCPDTFKTLLGKMATAGVQDVIYTRYPEPGNPPGSNTTLKNNLDTLMPKMEQVCKDVTAPRCHWVDLRPVWVNGDTSDGLHPTQSGGNHCGDAIWAQMVKDCLAQ